MRSRSLLWSFNYAIEGIVYALRTQRNMRIHVAAAIAALTAALVLRIGPFEFLALVIAIVFVLITELINTAIEATVDLATTTSDPTAKIAKDVAAGAVFIAAINAVVTAYVVFAVSLNTSAERLVTRVRELPLHVAVIALGLTMLFALVGKAASHSGTWLRGGWPSGHTAIAACIATAISVLAQNPQVTLLALLVVALVAQSRVESGAHSVPQVALGGLLGFLTALVVFQVFLG